MVMSARELMVLTTITEGMDIEIETLKASAFSIYVQLVISLLLIHFL